jgi:hypothetical protein
MIDDRYAVIAQLRATQVANAELNRRQATINRLRQKLHEGADHLDCAADILEEDRMSGGPYKDYASQMRRVADEDQVAWESMLDFQSKEIERLKELLRDTVNTLDARRGGVGDFALSGSEHVLLGRITAELKGSPQIRHAEGCNNDCMGCTCPPNNCDPGNICQHCYYTSTSRKG